MQKPQIFGFALAAALSLVSLADAAVLRTPEGQVRISANGYDGNRGFDGTNNYGNALSGSNGFNGGRGGDGWDGRNGGNATDPTAGSRGDEVHLWVSRDPANANQILVHGHAIDAFGQREETPQQTAVLQAEGALVVAARGGDGGAGGAGGQGEGGGSGGRGGDADRFTGFRSGDGGNGGDGGNAGAATSGADGGWGGTVHLYGAAEFQDQIRIDVSGGMGGSAGRMGRAGYAGNGGEAGNLCYYDYSSSPPQYQCVSRGSYGMRGFDGRPSSVYPRAGQRGNDGQTLWH